MFRPLRPMAVGGLKTSTPIKGLSVKGLLVRLLRRSPSTIQSAVINGKVPHSFKQFHLKTTNLILRADAGNIQISSGDIPVRSIWPFGISAVSLIFD